MEVLTSNDRSLGKKSLSPNPESVLKAKKPKAMSIRYNELVCLCAAVRHIPERTPKRISTLVSDVNTCMNFLTLF